MKTMFKSALVAVAALSVGLAGCNKGNGEGAVDNNGTRTVALAIQKQAATRAALGGDGVLANTFTNLNNGVIYFFNSIGDVVYVYQLTSTDLTALTTNNTPIPNEKSLVIIQGVQTTANSAAMIANYPDYPGTTYPVVANWNEFKAVSLEILKQADMAGHTTNQDQNFGAGAVANIALIDQKGNSDTYGNKLLPVSSVQADGVTHNLEITLVPGVARFEIAKGAFTVGAANATNLESFDLTGLYFSNFHKTYTMGLTPSDLIGGLASGLQNSTGGLNNGWIAEYKNAVEGTAGGSAYANILYDEFTTARNITNAVNTYGGFAYHAFEGSTPHIIIAGKNFKFAGANALTETKFWRIDEYLDNNRQPVTPKMGKVYKITGITLGAKQPGDHPYGEDVTVKATVVVKAWDAQVVTVNPK